MEIHRTCTKCGATSNIAKFGKRTGAYKYGVSSICTGCVNAMAREAYKKNRDRILSQRRKNFHASDRQAKMQRAWKFGISIDQLNTVLSQSNNTCSICGVKQKDGEQHLHIDHNHINGDIRGILCHKCNKGLGFFLDNPKLLRMAAAYIEKEPIIKKQFIAV